MLYLRSFQIQYIRLDEYYNVKNNLEKEVYQLIDIIAEDPSPEADSPTDPVWGHIEQLNDSNENLTLSLEDISSRFNLNFIRTKMLEESPFFKDLLINGKNTQNLKEDRFKYGFVSDIHSPFDEDHLGYGDFFEKEDLDKYFTTYGYANLNVTYEKSLEMIFKTRIPDRGTGSFMSDIKNLIESDIMADNSKMKKILGTEYEDLYPLINIQPLINVNFVEDEILKAILYYPYGGTRHKERASFYSNINNDRSNSEIDDARIKQLLPLKVEKEKDIYYLRIYEYLGAITWFWKITAESDNRTLTAIICRIPLETRAPSKRDYQIIEWDYR